ncbi:MAG: glycosyltransferase family 2 protein [Paracoccaceae bacterium]|nr:glycosyltransferase family 2 protein [Paracoccaceae bacterium]
MTETSETEFKLISFVVPFLNEEDTVEALHKEIEAAMSPLETAFEIIFVDDGSTDDSSKKVQGLVDKDDRVTLIQFRRNFGKAAALAAGFDATKGDVVFTMDADLQDDPKEIPRFLEEVRNGTDLVSGWKRRRNDPIDKTLPSRVFNWITSRTFNIEIHDINCGFKAYHRDVLPHLNLYGELHRFTPALANGLGFVVREVEVEHRAREHGVSKYGWTRFIKGLLDLMTVMLLTRYGARPLHFFARLGLPLVALGVLFVGYLSVLWLLDMGPIGTRPLLQIGILFIVTGIQLLGIGLIAELVSASRLSGRDPYVIKNQAGERNA